MKEHHRDTLKILACWVLRLIVVGAVMLAGYAAFVAGWRLTEAAIH